MAGQMVPSKDEPQTTTQQMALALFEDLLPSGGSISEAASDIGFLRNNIFVDIVELGLVARRAVDAAFFIVSQDPEIREAYEIDLSYFKWLMTYTSNNRKHLRTVLREAQKAAIEADAASGETERWGSIPLLGPVGIAGGRLIFEIDKRLQKLIKDPAQSHFLSLRVSNLFTSIYARSLYDHLLNYADVGSTDWLDVETVRMWTGASTKSMAEFKYFKRDALDPATEQINEVSNLTVSYTTGTLPGSKKVGRIRFTIKKRDLEKVLQLTMSGSKELYETLKEEFGLSQKNFEEIMENRATWTDEWLHQAMEFTRYSIQRGKVTKSVSGFLMKALRDNLRVSSSDRIVAEQLAGKEAADKAKARELELKTTAVASSNASADAKTSEEISAAIIEGLNGFDALAEDEKLAYLREFSRSMEAKLPAKRDKVDLSNLTESAVKRSTVLSKVFGQFMHRKLYAPATATKKPRGA